MVLGVNKMYRLYRLLSGLGNFAIEKYDIVPSLRDIDFSTDANEAERFEILDYIWSHTEVIDEYLRTEGANLSAKDRAAVESWKKVVSGTFAIESELPIGGVFLRIEGDDGFYVNTLVNSWASIVDQLGLRLPVVLKANLLPFDGSIVTDGHLPFLETSIDAETTRIIGARRRELKAERKMRKTL